MQTPRRLLLLACLLTFLSPMLPGSAASDVAVPPVAPAEATDVAPGVASDAGPEDASALLALVEELAAKGALSTALVEDARAVLGPATSEADLESLFLRVKAELVALAGIDVAQLAATSVVRDAAVGELDLGSLPCPNCQDVFNLCMILCDIILDMCQQVLKDSPAETLCNLLPQKCTDFCENVARICHKVCTLTPALPAGEAALSDDWHAGLAALDCDLQGPAASAATLISPALAAVSA